MPRPAHNAARPRRRSVLFGAAASLTLHAAGLVVILHCIAVEPRLLWTDGEQVVRDDPDAPTTILLPPIPQVVAIGEPESSIEAPPVPVAARAEPLNEDDVVAAAPSAASRPVEEASQELQPQSPANPAPEVPRSEDAAWRSKFSHFAAALRTALELLAVDPPRTTPPPEPNPPLVARPLSPVELSLASGPEVQPAQPAQPSAARVRAVDATQTTPSPTLAPGASPGVRTSSSPTPARANTPPVYPSEARRRRQEGTVLLRFDVNSDGGVVRVEIARSTGVETLDQAALRAARNWTFVPATVDGKPTACEVTLPVEFSLRPAAGSPPRAQ